MAENIESNINTLPKFLRENARRFGDRRIALREKDMGIWKSYTWTDYYEKVRDLCLGLVHLGFKRDDKLCIIGENKPEWFWAELAAQSAGGVAIGVFTDCQGPEIKYFFEHSESSFVIAHDQEQVDKVLDIKNELKKLKNIIYWDPKGLWGYEDSELLSMEKVMEMGRHLHKEKPHLYDEMVDNFTLPKCDFLVKTMGEKGIELSKMFGMSSNVPRYTEVYTHEVDPVKVYNVTGAGDTVVAMLAICIGVGMKPIDAVRIASEAARYVVTQRGTSYVPPLMFMDILI